MNRNIIIGLICLLILFLICMLASSYTPIVAGNPTNNASYAIQSGGATGPPASAPRANVLAQCPSGYTNNGTSCVKPSQSYALISTPGICPSGYTNNGTQCYRAAATKDSPSILATCPSGYSNNGYQCQNDA